jgi:hypothetical protein
VVVRGSNIHWGMKWWAEARRELGAGACAKAGLAAPIADGTLLEHSRPISPDGDINTNHDLTPVPDLLHVIRSQVVYRRPYYILGPCNTSEQSCDGWRKS